MMVLKTPLNNALKGILEVGRTVARQQTYGDRVARIAAEHRDSYLARVAHVHAIKGNDDVE